MFRYPAEKCNLAIQMEIAASKKIYFASDLHLGTPTFAASREREEKFIRWLTACEKDAAAIFIIGDIFDFWHEYKTVVPKGNVRLLGKLAAMADSGIAIHIFTGNHDLWMRDYFEKEIGAKVYIEPIQISINQHRFFIGHGDGLGPKDYKYKFIKKVFRNKMCQWLFRWLHPDIGISIANYFSYKSRYGNEVAATKKEEFLGEENEWLIQYCKRKLATTHYDYFIFGHRHLPIEFPLKENAVYINTGDWLYFCSYAVYDGVSVSLCYYEEAN